ncbi:MAG: 4Fe-4S ferredoxin, partial [Deltaproteobacteria bacterium]
MIQWGDKIREIAKKILKDKTVDLIIGFQKGTIPLRTKPVLIKDIEKVDLLHW